MNLFSIAFKSLRQRWLPSSLTGLSVALGVALMVAVLILNTVVSKMFQQTGSGYDLVIGANGSDLQLILSTIYRIDRPIENLPWRYYQELKERPGVKEAIPVNLGDTTEVGNFPIVGTNQRYFIAEYVRDKKFQLSGEPGKQGLRGTWDAVIGSEVARKNNWGIGQKFKMIHSGQDDHVHNEEFEVKSVIAPTGTPNDRTVFVHIDGFFALDEHAKPLNEAIQRESEFFSESVEEVTERYQDDITEILAHENESAEEHAHHHHHGPMSDLLKEVTAVLVVMEGDDLERANRTLMLQQELKEGLRVQGANTVQVMSRLLTNLVGNVRLAFLYLTGLIIIVSGIGIFVSIYNSMTERRREIAIMRALGAQRQTVFTIILIESLLLCLLGAIGGILLGHGLVYVAAPIVEARSGLLIDPFTFTWVELTVIPLMILMASLIGILPGLTAYRTDVADALNS